MIFLKKPLDVVEDHLYKPGIPFSYKRWVFHGKNYKSSSDYKFGSGNRSNELGMETFFVEDANIDNIEENDEMYDIVHGIYGPQIHAQQSNLGNDTVLPNMEDGEIDGIATLLSEAKKMLFLGAMLFLLKFIMKLLHIKVLNK